MMIMLSVCTFLLTLATLTINTFYKLSLIAHVRCESALR